MITLYAACLRHLGLSQEDAGVVHDRYGTAVRSDTIKSWASGRRDAPLGAFQDLAEYAKDARAKVAPPPDIAQALFLAENASPSVADDLGLPSTNALISAIAAGLMRS